LIERRIGSKNGPKTGDESRSRVDYIPPSVSEAKKYLLETGRQEWSEEIGLMIEMHHKVRKYKTHRYPLVERFRKGDLVDFPLVFLSSASLPHMCSQSRRPSPIMDFTAFS
jgi:hypothetical protein